MSLFIEGGTKAELSIHRHLLSSFDEFKRFTRPVKDTEYSYLLNSRFLSTAMREELSLLQICILGHGFNENIHLIGENSGNGILERHLYATFSYSRKEPVEFIVIPTGRYSSGANSWLAEFFSGVIKRKARNFLWRSLIGNPYNKAYDELINVFAGSSGRADDNFVEYRISKG
jgi:hypothetical protein